MSWNNSWSKFPLNQQAVESSPHEGYSGEIRQTSCLKSTFQYIRTAIFCYVHRPLWHFFELELEYDLIISDLNTKGKNQKSESHPAEYAESRLLSINEILDKLDKRFSKDEMSSNCGPSTHLKTEEYLV